MMLTVQRILCPKSRPPCAMRCENGDETLPARRSRSGPQSATFREEWRPKMSRPAGYFLKSPAKCDILAPRAPGGPAQATRGLCRENRCRSMPRGRCPNADGALLEVPRRTGKGSQRCWLGSRHLAPLTVIGLLPMLMPSLFSHAIYCPANRFQRVWILQSRVSNFGFSHASSTPHIKLHFVARIRSRV